MNNTSSLQYIESLFSILDSTIHHNAYFNINTHVTRLLRAIDNEILKPVATQPELPLTTSETLDHDSEE